MIQTFKLKDKDVQQVIKHLPFQNANNMNAIQETVVTVIDEAVQRGLLQGMTIGEKKGEAKGKEIMKIKTPIETILKLVKPVPNFTSAQIAAICDVEEKFVLDVLKTFKNKQETTLKKFVRRTFKNIEGIEEKDFLQLEKELIAIWKNWNKIVR